MQWRVDLEKVSVAQMPTFNPRLGGMGGGQVNIPAERLLAFHPIVLGDQVIVCDGTRVLAYNLNDRPAEGENSSAKLVVPVWKFPAEEDGVHARQHSQTIPRYTLTAFGNRIYARMASRSTSAVTGVPGRSNANSIIALDWSTQGKFLWEQRSSLLTLPNKPLDRLGNRSVSFEGTPVADERNVYVAVTDRRDKTEIYIACFDADSGAVRWIRYVGAGSPDGQPNNFAFGGFQPAAISPSDFNHRLLSLDGSTLYYQTNLGALVAIDAATGSTLWVATYPRHDVLQLGSALERDLNPAVIHDGRVFIAPTDADAIFAFDSSSGRLLWKSERIADDIKLSHLLGVARGSLVATGNRVVLFNVKTGEMVHAWPDAGRPSEGYGRGLLAGDKIYWPTQNEIEILDQRSGLRARAPIELLKNFHVKGGNLISGDGYLIVAQEDGMVVFCQNSRLIERYRQQIVLAPDDASNYFRLARAAEASGGDQLALEMYANAIAKARANEIIDGAPLPAAARNQQFRLLLRLAANARKAGKWDEAALRLKTAVTVTRSGNEQLEAQLLLADVLEAASRPGDAVAICQQLLSDDRLRSLPVGAADGHRTVRADLMIGDRLKAIIAQHGRSVYARFDKEAAALFERGKKEKDPLTLDHVCRAYPEARVVPDALLRARRPLRAGPAAIPTRARPTSASRQSQPTTTAAHSPSGGWRTSTRPGSFWSQPGTATSSCSPASPPRPWSDDGSQSPSRRARRRRARPPALCLDRRRSARTAHSLAPLQTLALAAPAQPVRAHFDRLRRPPVARLRPCFLGREHWPPPARPLHGAPRWAADLGAPAVWAAYVSDKLIVATTQQIAALELSQGTIQWRFDVSKAGKEARRPDPFANPPDGPELPLPAGPNLSCFQLVNGRVFCLRNHSELIALDGDSGALDWSFTSPPAEINTNLWFGADKVVLQIDKPNQLLVLRTE